MSQAKQPERKNVHGARQAHTSEHKPMLIKVALDYRPKWAFGPASNWHTAEINILKRPELTLISARRVLTATTSMPAMPLSRKSHGPRPASKAWGFCRTTNNPELRRQVTRIARFASPGPPNGTGAALQLPSVVRSGFRPDRAPGARGVPWLVQHPIRRNCRFVCISCSVRIAAKPNKQH
jgi:hypothetical protein